MGYSKLRGLIREKYRTERDFAKAMGMSSVSVSNRLNDKVGWKIEEIKKAADLLSIDKFKVYSYFFKD